MTKPAMVIINPVSANGKTRSNWPQIKATLEQTGLAFDTAFTTGRLDATYIAREALKNGYETIVSVGGDGTLNEVANGFFDNDVMINESSQLGIIAGGTGGDFIRTLSYPKDFAAACQVIARGQTRAIDLGKMNYTNNQGQAVTSYFINIAGFGLDGAVVDRVNRTSKFFGGFLSFLYGTIAGTLEFHSFPLTLEVDGQLVYEGMTTVVTVANGQYFGGSMQIAPGAVLDDGIFEIVIVEGLTKGRLLKCLPAIYSGAHGQFPEVRFLQGTRVRAISPQRVLLDMDGEQPGILNAEFSILPRALNIIC